jgi:hypothetical protein
LLLLAQPSRSKATIPSPLGVVSLQYRVTPGKIAVGVIDKPMLVPCSKIDAALKQALAAAPKAPPMSATAVAAAKTVATATAAANPTGHVTTLPTQYIEGTVPKAGMSLWQWVAVAVGLAVAAGGAYWFVHRARRK